MCTNIGDRNNASECGQLMIKSAAQRTNLTVLLLLPRLLKWPLTSQSVSLSHSGARISGSGRVCEPRQRFSLTLDGTAQVVRDFSLIRSNWFVINEQHVQIQIVFTPPPPLSPSSIHRVVVACDR